MNNLRFATIVHILVLTNKLRDSNCNENKDKIITSDYIAGSINVNPVVVRREIKILKEAGILGSKKGKDGGCFLIKDPSEITFGELYKIIYEGNTFGKLNQTNPNCPVGKKMNTELNLIFSNVENEIINNLSKITLKNFSDQF